MKRFQKGFTLIELLAVIAIIGILAALILVSLSNARKQARDTQRKSTARAIAQAEESYYNNNNIYVGLSGLTAGTSPYLNMPVNNCKASPGSSDINLPWSKCIDVTATTYRVKVYLESDPNKGFECTEGGNCKDI
ncbi:MAG: type II secretion system protein [Patescibacteria group bacterium]|nr:type II secretion system protein [Patescibacteria group bacterium]